MYNRPKITNEGTDYFYKLIKENKLKKIQELLNVFYDFNIKISHELYYNLVNFSYSYGRVTIANYLIDNKSIFLPITKNNFRKCKIEARVMNIEDKLKFFFESKNSYNILNKKQSIENIFFFLKRSFGINKFDVQPDFFEFFRKLMLFDITNYFLENKTLTVIQEEQIRRLLLSTKYLDIKDAFDWSVNYSNIKNIVGENESIILNSLKLSSNYFEQKTKNTNYLHNICKFYIEQYKNGENYAQINILSCYEQGNFIDDKLLSKIFPEKTSVVFADDEVFKYKTNLETKHLLSEDTENLNKSNDKWPLFGLNINFNKKKTGTKSSVSICTKEYSKLKDEDEIESDSEIDEDEIKLKFDDQSLSDDDIFLLKSDNLPKGRKNR